jgi:CheY-like chemotaxis protein
MPEMDGYEAVRAIRQEESRRADGCRVPVIALTAHAAKSDRDDCLAAGMDDYLSKPLDPPVLAAMLEKWMPKAARPVAIALAENALPAVDYPGLLRRCLNKPDLAARLLNKLVQQAEQDVVAIATAIQDIDMAMLASVAHRLKGASANVAAEPMRRLASALEDCGRRGELVKARPLVPQLQLELLRLKRMPEEMASLDTAALSCSHAKP